MSTSGTGMKKESVATTTKDSGSTKECKRKSDNPPSTETNIPHNDEKPFKDESRPKKKIKVQERKCNQCDFVATNGAMLVKHVSANHGGKEGKKTPPNPKIQHRFKKQITKTEEETSTSRKDYLSKVYQQNDDCNKMDNPFICDLCDKECVSNVALFMHKKSVHQAKNTRKFKIQDELMQKEEDGQYSCRKCFKIYKSITQVYRHINDDHIMSRVFTCSICAKKYASATALYNHKKNSHHLTNLHCDKCGVKFESKQEVKIHSQGCQESIIVEETGFTCNVCSELFDSKNGLTSHCQKEHPDQSHQCNKCDKSFGTRFCLLTHIKELHRAAPSFQCPHCIKAYASQYVLNDHVRLVHEKPKWSCQECDYGTFDYPGKLARHLFEVHQIVAESECNYCNRLFPGIPALLAHHRVSHPEKKYTCRECGKGMERLGLLKNHLEKYHRFTKENLDIVVSQIKNKYDFNMSDIDSD